MLRNIEGDNDSPSDNEGFPPERFTSDVPKSFMCPVCNLVMRNPTNCVCCGHTFCNKCIEKWLESSAICPICDQTARPTSRNIFAERVIGERLIKCKFEGRGCTAQVRVDQLATHTKDCGFARGSCPHKGCVYNNIVSTNHKQVLLRKDEKEHTKQCEWRIVECPNKCLENENQSVSTTTATTSSTKVTTLAFRDIESHIAKECARQLVSCDNGCNARVMRGQLQSHKQDSCPKRVVECNAVGCGFRWRKDDNDAWFEHWGVKPSNGGLLQGLQKHSTCVKQVIVDLQQTVTQQGQTIAQQGQTIVKLEQERAQQGKIIHRQTQVINQQTQVIAQQSQTIGKLEQECAQQGQTIAQQGLTIRRLEQEHAQQKQAINQQGQTISQQDQAINQQNQTITTLEQRMTTLEKNFQSKIGQLEAQLSKQSTPTPEKLARSTKGRLVVGANNTVRWRKHSEQGNDFDPVGEPQQARAITSVNLYECGLGVDDIKIISTYLSYLTTVTKLDLGAWAGDHRPSKLGAEGVRHLSQVLRSWTHLQELNLGCCSLGVEGSAVLARILPHLTQLHTLYLYWNDIKEAGMEQLLEPIASLTNLKYLDLEYNELSDECVERVRARLSFVQDLRIGWQSLW